MELSDIQKAVADFEAKLKPVTPQMKAMAAGVAVKEEPALPPPSPPVEEGGACFSKDFKNLVVALPQEYIGQGGIKVLLMETVGSLMCKEGE